MGVDYDNRTSLVGSCPFSLVFGEKSEQRTFSLTEEIGRGSSCITYLATEEGAGSRPKATRVVKEFYPLPRSVDGLCRTAKGFVSVPDNQRQRFDDKTNSFIQGLERFSEIYELSNLAGVVTLPRPDYIEGNGTVYAISDFHSGSTLSLDDVCSMEDVARVMVEICGALGALHGYEDPESGESDPLLYLDCKPHNLYLYRGLDNNPHVCLFDFDMVTRLADFKTSDPPLYSLSSGWCAPEQETQDYSSICEATDVFTAGAVFFWLVTGREVSSDVVDVVSCDFGFPWREEKRQTLHFDAFEKIEQLVDDIARDSLAPLASDRYATASALGFAHFFMQSDFLSNKDAVSEKDEGMAKAFGSALLSTSEADCWVAQNGDTVYAGEDNTPYVVTSDAANITDGYGNILCVGTTYYGNGEADTTDFFLWGGGDNPYA